MIVAAPLRGILCMLGGGLLLTVNDAVMKWLTADYPLGQVLFLRGAFVFLPIALLTWQAGGIAALRVRNVPGQAVRAAAMICSSFLFIGGLSLLPLADAIALSFAGPLFLTALATPMLGERVGWRRWSAVLIGFAGVLVMLRPTGEALYWAALLPLGAALAGAFRDVFTRRIAVTETTISILAVGTAAVALAGLSTAPFGWQPVAARDVGLFALAGFLLGGAHYLMIESFRFAEVALVAPFKYASMLWATLFGFLVWGHLPESWVLAGSALVIGSGLYILHRETRGRWT